MRNSETKTQSPIKLLLGVGLAFLLALAVFWLLMNPDSGDMAVMAAFLALSSVVSLASGYAASRSGWMSRMPSLRWALLTTYVVAGLLSFFNVWLTARLMFVSAHDLQIATILLLFASGIALALGSFFSETISGRLAGLRGSIREIRRSGFSTRAEILGNDEIAELALELNEMASQLEAGSKKRDELEQMRKDLITWVGHDLQTPLASIRAIVEALADGLVEEPEDRARYLSNAKREIQSLSLLIDDLFQMSQLDSGDMLLNLEANSLSDLISDTLERFSALAKEKGVFLDGRVEEEVDPVRMDAQRIGRVLNNLMGNAIRHTTKGGEVFLSARRVGDKVEVELRDSGEGLKGVELDKIFDRFYRGEESRSRQTGGVGLGLVIAQGFVEAHGGKIRAETGDEGGAQFVFWLPNK